MRSLTSIYLFSHVAILLIAGYCFGFSPAFARFEFSEVHMGTQFKIILYCEGSHAATLASLAFKRVAEIDAITSDYRETSELMVLCKQPTGTKVTLSKDLFRVLAASQNLAIRWRLRCNDRSSCKTVAARASCR